MENKSLYNINNEFLNIIQELESNGGEFTPEIEQALAINKEQLQNKTINAIYIIRKYETETDYIDAEIARLQGLKKARVKIIDGLKDRLKKAMELHELTEIKTPLFTLSFRKSVSTEVYDVEKLPNHFIKYVKKPDIMAIKCHILEGNEVDGAKIVESLNLQIK